MPRGEHRPNGSGRVDRDSQAMRYPLFSSSLTKARIDVHNHRMRIASRYAPVAPQNKEEE